MDKQWNVPLSIFKKEWTTDTCNNMDNLKSFIPSERRADTNYYTIPACIDKPQDPTLKHRELHSISLIT